MSAYSDMDNDRELNDWKGKAKGFARWMVIVARESSDARSSVKEWKGIRSCQLSGRVGHRFGILPTRQMAINQSLLSTGFPKDGARQRSIVRLRKGVTTNDGGQLDAIRNPDD
ncbi:hypothetical protein ETB97_001381 [Aspergillus alliaceus]|uniref:Uncharacterized protein n=1 Tax=Petromyces alliaceus TaxID=209559 RepID=A0A8H6E6Q5_PETAA|nr:hypothetical protein ETB97_001381 [Aspergillus burnettii]